MPLQRSFADQNELSRNRSAPIPRVECPLFRKSENLRCKAANANFLPVFRCGPRRKIASHEMVARVDKPRKDEAARNSAIVAKAGFSRAEQSSILAIPAQTWGSCLVRPEGWCGLIHHMHSALHRSESFQIIPRSTISFSSWRSSRSFSARVWRFSRVSQP